MICTRLETARILKYMKENSGIDINLLQCKAPKIGTAVQKVQHPINDKTFAG